MRQKAPKFKGNELVEAVQPCMIAVPDPDAPDGQMVYSFNPGKQRIRASHPAVQANPGAFQAIDPEADGD